MPDPLFPAHADGAHFDAAGPPSRQAQLTTMGYAPTTAFRHAIYGETAAVAR
jgi:hypothetical protein